MGRITIAIAMVVALLLPAASATTYLVKPDGSGDYPTIQEAIDAAASADTVFLADGVYAGNGNRDISFLGKAIVLCSLSDEPDACTIDCQGSPASPHRGILMSSHEGLGTTVRGVTITNGYVTIGGAISINGNCRPTITNCAFIANHASDRGGAVASWGGDSGQWTLSACRFDGNSAVYGGAVSLDYPGIYVLDCFFASNSATSGGGAIVFGPTGGALAIRGCTFASNLALEGGAVCVYYSSNNYFTCESSTFWENSATYGSAIHNQVSLVGSISSTLVACGLGGSAVMLNPALGLECCNIYGNAGGDWVGSISGQLGQNGNICLDPLFCDAGAGDFTVREDSPCAPHSYPNPECELIGAWPVACEAPPGPTFVVRPNGSGDYPTIQAAVDAAPYGTVIELADGVFAGTGNKNIQTLGRVLTIESQSGARDACIIDCQDTGSAFDFHNYEGFNTIVQGITVRRADSGGIRIANASPTIGDCAFLDNWGSGIQSEAASPRVAGCLFRGNVSQAGGGISCVEGSPAVDSCTFVENLADWGGALRLHECDTATVRSCTFLRNAATYYGGGCSLVGGLTQVDACTFSDNLSDLGGGIWLSGSAQTTVSSTIIASALDGGGIRCETGSIPLLSCTDIFGNAGGDWIGHIAGQEGINGNFSADPCFCDAENDDFTLWNYSPCAQFGCGTIGAWPVACWDAQRIADSDASLAARQDLLRVSASPNPFSGTTSIRFSLPQPGGVRVGIFDMAGREVRSLVVDGTERGSASLTWDGRGHGGQLVPAGVYWVRASQGNRETATRVMILR